MVGAITLVRHRYSVLRQLSTCVADAYQAVQIITSYAGGSRNMPRPLQVDLWPFDLENGVQVTCDVGYLCANFSLPRPLFYT